METTSTRRRTVTLRIPPIRDYGAPGWFERLPSWAGVGGILLLLVGLSTVLRIDYLSGELWYDEAASIGIASHPLTSIPGILWHGGGAPLYFMVLHVWMAMFGDSEAAVRLLSVLLGVLSVPIAMWLGWSLYGRRIALMFAMLMTFNAYLTKYAEEARPYELFAVLGLLATGALLHAFVYRRRRGWLPAFTVCLALLAYTDAWAFFYWAGAALAIAFVWARSEPRERSELLRDAALAFGIAFVLYLPWLPTLLHQFASATAPFHYAPFLGANPLRNTLGSDRVTATVALAVIAGCVPLLAGAHRRERDATAIWVLAVAALGAVLLALISTLLVSGFAGRYLAPVVAALLLLVAIGCARSGILGLALLLISCSFVADASAFVSGQKSDMREVAALIQPRLHRGDMVLVVQPEQAPLVWYYFPAGVRYATALGPDPHPTYMNWDNARTRLVRANPASVLNRLVASLAPGQHLVLVRPLTEGVQAWTAPWARLVRLRAAQWSAAIEHDPQLVLVPGSAAPRFYRSSCCIASTALIYTKR